MTPKQFKEKWENGKKIGMKGVNFSEIYQCAIDWNLLKGLDYSDISKLSPRDVLILVLNYANVEI